MTCPHCGAYSPKNTATCNRCGRKLPLLETQREQQRILAESGKAPAPTRPEHEGYGYGYRQPEQTKLGLLLEKVGTFLDENLLERPTVKKAVLVTAAMLFLLIIFLCATGNCGGDGDNTELPVSTGDTAVVSAADASGSDVASQSDAPIQSAEA